MGGCSKRLLVLFFFGFHIAYGNVAPLSWTVNANKTLLAAVFSTPSNPKQQHSNYVYLRIYSLEKNCLLREMAAEMHKKEKVVSVTMDKRGRYTLLITNQANYIYHIANATRVYACPSTYTCALPNANSYAALHNGEHVRFLNLNTGEVAGTYRSQVKNGVKKMEFMPKGKWLIYGDGNAQVFIHKTFTRNPKKIKGAQWTITPNGILYTVLADAKKIHVCIYDVYQERMVDQYDIKENNFSILKDPNATATLAPAGKYLLARSDANKDTLLYKVYNLEKNQPVDMTIHALRNDRNATAEWYRDSLLLVRVQRSALLFNPANPFHMVNADYGISKKTDIAGKTESWFPDKKTIHTSDHVYAYAIHENTTHIRCAFMGEKSQCIVPQAELLDYHAPSSVFLFSYRDSLAWLSSEDVELSDVTHPVPAHMFGNCLPVGDPPTTSVKRPSEERYTFSTGIQRSTEKDLSKVGVNLSYQSAWASDTTVNIEFQVFDKFGSFYSGLTDSTLRNIWCNIQVYDKNGKPVETRKAKLHEFNQWNTEAADIAIVMDHSGSMGQENANRVHLAAEKLIEYLDPRDRAFIAKYDGKVEVFSDLTNDKEALQSSLNKKGYSSFAGSTSIVDALYYANERLKKSSGNRKRFIYLVTDGMENSSATPIAELLKELESSGTRVYSIGFGTNISDGFLKGLAYRSKGGFYKVFNTEELEKIYKDVYFKSRNYYRLDIHVDKNLARYVNVKACFPTGKDSMLVRYADESKLTFTGNEYYKVKNPEELQKDTLVSGNLVKRYFPTVKKTTGPGPEIFYTKPGTVSDVLTREEDPGRKKIPSVTPTDTTQTVDVEEPVSEAKVDFEKLVLPILLFKYDSDEIVTTDVDKQLAPLLAYLKKHPETGLSVYAHTDSRGDLVYNNKLSLKRAERVVNLLIKKGVDATRLSAHAMGEGTPVATNQTEEGMQQNRRAIFELEE